MTAPDADPAAKPTRGAGAASWLYDAPVLLLTLTTLFWGMNAVMGRAAVGEISPFQLTFMRWVLVSAALWLLFGHEVRAHWEKIRPKLGQIVLMAFFGFTAFNTLFYIAAEHTTAVNIGILQGSMPVFVLLGAVALHNTPVSFVQSLGVAVTFVGVLVVATRGALLDVFDLEFNEGDLLMLLACVFYACYTVALRNRPNIPGRAFFTLMTPIAAITAAPLAIVETVWWDVEAPTVFGWTLAVLVAIFPSCLAQLFFLRGVDLIGPARAGVFINLVPVFAALLAVLFLEETFALYHATALTLVLSGIWLAQRKPRVQDS